MIDAAFGILNTYILGSQWLPTANMAAQPGAAGQMPLRPWTPTDELTPDCDDHGVSTRDSVRPLGLPADVRRPATHHP